MKRLLIVLLAGMLALSFIACGKGDKEQGTAGTAGTAPQDKDQKVEDKKIEPDSVDNLFLVLDQAIKKGELAKAKALFTPASIAKINNPDNAAFLGDTLYGQIQFEIKSRFQNKAKAIKAAGAGMTRTVVWPSAKTTTVAVEKVGTLYKLDLVKSTGGDSLE